MAVEYLVERSFANSFLCKVKTERFYSASPLCPKREIFFLLFRSTSLPRAVLQQRTSRGIE
jgi:hypothetical protein